VRIEEDRWLSERLGRPAFTLRDLGDGADLGPLERHRAEQRAATYQAKVPTRRVDLVQRLGAGGLGVVSTGVTLSRDPAGAPSSHGDGRFEVRDLDPERDRDVLAIAASSFRHSRFHLDPEIPIEVADQIKHDWTESYFRGTRGEKLMVARDGVAVGFLAVIAARVEGTTARSIDLIAVAHARQGEGVGRALVLRFLDESARLCDIVTVGTQTANEAAIRFYERLGFTVAATSYDLHGHVGLP